MTGSPDSPSGGPHLEPLSWPDKVFLDTHKAAIEKAIESADGGCAAVVAACFSLATVYGAAIALLIPDDSQAPPAVVIWPLISLVLGAAVALVGKTAGISLRSSFDRTDQVRDAVKRVVWEKRILSWIGVVAAGTGAVGGLVALI